MDQIMTLILSLLVIWTVTSHPQNASATPFLPSSLRNSLLVSVSETSTAKKKQRGKFLRTKNNETKTSSRHQEELETSDSDDSPTTSSSSSQPEDSKPKNWRETRKPIADSPSDNKKSGLRIPILRFGLRKKTVEDDKNNDTSDDSDNKKAPSQEKIGKKAQIKENEKNVSTRQSRYERAKKARQKRLQVNSNNTETERDIQLAAKETSSSTANNTSDDTLSPHNNTKPNNETVPSNKRGGVGGIPNTPPGFSIGGYSIGSPMMYPPSGRPYHLQPHSPQQPRPMQPSQALAVTAIVSVLSVLSRLGIVVWITKRLSVEEEMIQPKQHFVWECLNDRYSKDSSVLRKAFSKPPLQYTKQQWKKYTKQLGPKRATKPKAPIRTSIVVNLTPNGGLDLNYLSDVVNFLILAHSNQRFGPEVELILKLASPGGAVTTYGLAAAQIARLQNAGLTNATICIDDVAASGGYMMASQGSQIVAAPFSMVGSIGVIREGLNYNEILEKHGVKPLILKAGEMKNPISSFGKVSKQEIEEETKRMEHVHEQFIELCQKNRPTLETGICDGTILTANAALSFGLVDRILTSDEYILERIAQGDLVMHLHRTQGSDPSRLLFARALDVLPHLATKWKSIDKDKVLGHVVRGLVFGSMLHNKFF